MPKKIRRAQPRPYHHGDLRRALIDTAQQLVTEEQDWAFSLREVARRAGVSHRAPYNHFPEKLDLLAAIAALGFERLRDGMLRAMASVEDADARLAAIMGTYIRLGCENPALYRLMFGPALSNAGAGDRPSVAKAAGAEARGVLEDVIRRGARAGLFAVSPDDPEDVAAAALSVWSATHGLTMLAIDKVSPTNLSIDKAVFEEFAAEADRRRMTLFAFANESLSAISKISREGGNPDEFYKIWRVLSILRQVDVITLPSDFVEELIEVQYKADMNATRAKFRNLGTSLIGLLKMAAENIEDLTPLAKDFGFFIPIKHFAITKLKTGFLEITVVGAGKVMETTECSAEFLKSIIEGYGYAVTKEELHPGTIRFLADKTGRD